MTARAACRWLVAGALALGLAGCSSVPLPALPTLGEGTSGGLSQAEQEAVIRDLSSAEPTPSAVPEDATSPGTGSVAAVPLPPAPADSLSPQR